MTKEDRIEIYNKFMGLKRIPANRLDNLGFFDAPASTRFHGAYAGGLFDHSFAVAKYLVELTERLGLKWSRECSPYFVGMYHDFCKCGMYRFDEAEDRYRYREDLIIPGHGERSLIMLLQQIDLTDEEIACIRWHMGAYETDTSLWQYYNRAVMKYTNVLFTHTADMYASKVLRV